ncbi:hypothetical protein BJ912DRAFT_965515, partial [Pholiota molesta]
MSAITRTSTAQEVAAIAPASSARSPQPQHPVHVFLPTHTQRMPRLASPLAQALALSTITRAATTQEVATITDIGPPPFHDADGSSPIYIGSVLMQDSIQPCTIGPDLRPYGYHGRYDLLPFRPHEMEWVPTSHGRIPYGRRPIDGGYEEKGAKLYHAAAHFNGLRVPGKAGEHLGGARISFGGREYEVSDNYEL